MPTSLSLNKVISLESSGTTGDIKLIQHDLNDLFGIFEKQEVSSDTTVSLLNIKHAAGLNLLLKNSYWKKRTYFFSQEYLSKLPSFLRKMKNCEIHLTPSIYRFIIFKYGKVFFESMDISQMSFGSEPLSLDIIKSIYPQIRIKQVYGSTETWEVPSITNTLDPRFIKIDPNFYQYKIKDKELYLKGYTSLNTPIDEDGYFKTEDLVEENGNYLRITGRKGRILNIAGKLISLDEVESFVEAQMEEVSKCLAFVKSCPILDSKLGLKVILKRDIPIGYLKKSIRALFKERFHKPAIIEKVSYFKLSPNLKAVYE